MTRTVFVKRWPLRRILRPLRFREPSLSLRDDNNFLQESILASFKRSTLRFMSVHSQASILRKNFLSILSSLSKSVPVSTYVLTPHISWCCCRFINSLSFLKRCSKSSAATYWGPLTPLLISVQHQRRWSIFYLQLWPDRGSKSFHVRFRFFLGIPFEVFNPIPKVARTWWYCHYFLQLFWWYRNWSDVVCMFQFRELRSNRNRLACFVFITRLWWQLCKNGSAKTFSIRT